MPSPAAELGKLRSLPAVPVTAALTILAMAGLTWLELRQPGGGDGIVTTVRYGQIGTILLAALTVNSEYGGHQIRTSLLAVPNRVSLLAGKVVAYLAVSGATALVSMAVSGALAEQRWETELGGTAYLVLIGLLAGAAGLLIRNLVGTLVTMLSLVIVVSPLLVSVTRFANYLPDQAGALFYRAGALTPIEGGAALGGWIVLVGAVAVVVFLRKDA